MENLANFVFEQKFNILTLTINNEPWFKGADICATLGFTNSRKALIDHVDSEDKQTINLKNFLKNQSSVTNCYGNILLSNNGGNPNVTFINESGLYALIFGSKLPSAKSFKRWVTSEVLPQLRKTGSYSLTNAQPQTAQIEQKTCSWMDLRSCRKDPLKAGKQGFYCAAKFLSAFIDRDLETNRLTREFEVFCSNVARMDGKDREAKNAFLSVFVKVLRCRLDHLRICADYVDEVEDELTLLLNKKRMMFEKEVLTEQ